MEALFESSGLCRIVDSRGNERARFSTVFSQAFNSQYPPPLSLDEQVLYVGTWERGLFCYDIATGALRWRHGPGKVRRIFPVDGGVVTEMCHRGLFRRDQSTGVLRGKVAMGGIELAARLTKERLFAGPLRRRYLVFSLPELRPVEVVSASDLNPDGCLSFVIREVRQVGRDVLVSGFEEFPDGDYSRSGSRDFERRVPTRPA